MPETLKAITPQRDHRQSAWLVALFSAALLLSFPYRTLHPDHWLWLVLGVSLTFGLLVWLLRAATPGGALAGGAICLSLTYLTGSGSSGLQHSGLVPLMTLFILTFAATKLGKHRKQQASLAESRRGRTAAQVIANLGAAALLYTLCAPFIAHHAMRGTATALLACLAEATADTVASEIGQAFGGTPRLLPSMRPVSPGTDGAVSLTGTLAGLVASALLMLAASLVMPTILSLTIAWIAGLAGFFFDTILGATLERKGWLGNDLVNFFSTLFAALCALLLCAFS